MKHNATVYTSPDGRYVRIETAKGIHNVLTRPPGHGKMTDAARLAQLGLPGSFASYVARS